MRKDNLEKLGGIEEAEKLSNRVTQEVWDFLEAMIERIRDQEVSLKDWQKSYEELAKRANVLEHRMGQIAMILGDDIEEKPIRDF